MENFVVENVIEPAIIMNELTGDKPGDTTMNAAFLKLIKEMGGSPSILFSLNK
ncbi:hypothetical protein [Neobacillus jeddahensis]|uniref:hypothetical protein n=1 Tax=Neobacillus jeddahensis TaxID=1461580 RepID=UPI000AB33C22|nr:hypothetical protein [Neobacillus jeddahensis]